MKYTGLLFRTENIMENLFFLVFFTIAFFFIQYGMDLLRYLSNDQLMCMTSGLTSLKFALLSINGCIFDRNV